MRLMELSCKGNQPEPCPSTSDGSSRSGRRQLGRDAAQSSRKLARGFASGGTCAGTSSPSGLRSESVSWENVTRSRDIWAAHVRVIVIRFQLFAS